MRNKSLFIGAFFRILIGVILLICVALLIHSRDSFVPRTCVEMPNPKDAVSVFLDALIDGRYEDCDELLSNYETLGLGEDIGSEAGSRLFKCLGESYNYRIIDDNSYSVIFAEELLYPAQIISHTDAMDDNTSVYLSDSDLTDRISEVEKLMSNPSVLVVFSELTEEGLAEASSKTLVSGKNATVAVAFTYLDIPSISNDLKEVVSDVAYEQAMESMDIQDEEAANQILNSALDILSGYIIYYYRTDIIYVELEYIEGEWKIKLDDDLYNAILGNIV